MILEKNAILRSVGFFCFHPKDMRKGSIDEKPSASDAFITDMYGVQKIKRKKIGGHWVGRGGDKRGFAVAKFEVRYYEHHTVRFKELDAANFSGYSGDIIKPILSSSEALLILSSKLA